MLALNTPAVCEDEVRVLPVSSLPDNFLENIEAIQVPLTAGLFPLIIYDGISHVKFVATALLHQMLHPGSMISEDHKLYYQYTSLG